MKKLTKWIAMALSAMMLTATAAGCSRYRGDGGEEVNESMSQLSVGNLYAGFRDEWLQQWKKDFEEANKDKSFEPGKVGVQIWIDNQREAYAGKTLIDAISSYTQDIYFTEEAYMYDYVGKGAVAEITDIVTENLKDKYGEDTSIADKMNPALRDSCTINGKFYMLPVNEAYFGIVYDKDLFAEQGFYISKTSTSSRTRFTKVPAEFSAGVDGEEGTYDDGLPETYAQFYDLLQEIKNHGCMPLIWSGKYASTYGDRFMNALWTDAEGYDQMQLNSSLSGTATSLVETVNTATKKYGSADYDVSTVTLQPATEINENNAVLLQKQAGKFYALQFANNIIRDTTVRDSYSFTGSSSHTQTQSEYLYRKYTADGTKQRVAMLVDGSWWRAEAAQTFNNMVSTYGEEASAKSRNFGFMPMPKPNESMVGTGSTFFVSSNVYTRAFISSTCPASRLDLAKSFLQYCFTHKAMKDYTLLTDTTMPYEYGLSADEETELYGSLTAYGKDLWDIHSDAKVYINDSSLQKVRDNHSYFTEDWNFRTSVTSPAINTRFAFEAFHNNTEVTPESYFNGMYAYHRQQKLWTGA